MDDQADFTDEQLRDEDSPGQTPSDDEAADDSPAGETPPKVPSDLDEGLENLKHVAVNVAARLFGPKLVNADEPERPTLSPEADKLVEDIGATVGHYLRAAGTALKDHPRDLNEASKEASELAKEPIKKEIEDGWSPLVQGARAFSVGLGSVMSELSERLRDQSAKPRAESSEPPSEPSEPPEEEPSEDDPAH